MAQRFSTAGFKIKASVKSTADLLHINMQLYLFRIVQELINNCIKHADATEAEIKVCTENGNIILAVSDNGVGFKQDLDHALMKGSGLRAIRNRIYLLGGDMQLETSERGTSIRITFVNDKHLAELMVL